MSQQESPQQKRSTSMSRLEQLRNLSRALTFDEMEEYSFLNMSETFRKLREERQNSPRKTGARKLLAMMRPKPGESAEAFTKRVMKSLRERGLMDKEGKLTLPPDPQQAPIKPFKKPKEP